MFRGIATVELSPCFHLTVARQNLLRQALKRAREILSQDTCPQPGDIRPDVLALTCVTEDSVFEGGIVTHLHLYKSPLNATTRTAKRLAFTDSVPNDHAPGVLLTRLSCLSMT